jgi:hypothetical protein
MKSLCPTFKLTGDSTRQEGGALAIANHIRDFVSSVDLITNEGEEIVKTRYMDVGDEKKHVEINKFDTREFGPIEIDSRNYDVVIVADFGHGYCDDLTINGPFHLMCQTNSNNFGFNRLSKWKESRKELVCLDLREASLQMNSKIDPANKDEVLGLYNYEMDTEHLILTTGRQGAVYCDGLDTHMHESFPSTIVDTIGAGDTLYSFSALAVHTFDQPNDHLPVAMLAASLSTTWLANEQSVTKDKLIHYADRFV